MKGYLYVAATALTLGAIFALYIFQTNESQDLTALSSTGKVYYFQLAMFENEDNANKFVETLNGGVVVFDEENFRVYSAVYSNSYLVQKMQNYYDSNNIQYILKEDYLTGSPLEELLAYENIIMQSDNTEVMLKSNQLILDSVVLSLVN